jgi:hypothetical protein
VFLVNASLGLYPQSLEDREVQKQRLGRSRLVAAWAALTTVFRDYRPMSIKVEHEGRFLELRTLTLFVGNNRLHGAGRADESVVEEQAVGHPAKAVTRLACYADGAGRWAGLPAHGVQHFPLSLTTPLSRR